MKREEEVRVVVVDDCSDALQAMAHLLEAHGYAVRTASDGNEALSVVEDFEPLCVLMDIRMPGLNGHELASKLRSRHGRDIILIAVTGAGNFEDRVSPSFAQFDHYLRKPVDVDVLRKLLPPLA